jgi:nicotinamidase-related amidase
MNTSTPHRSSELYRRQSSRLLLVDLQERLVPVIPDRETLMARCRLLAQGAQILEIPIHATEQYPKGLGGTLPEIAAFVPNRPEKVRFSCTDCLGWNPPGPDERFQIVVAGIEAHVCVQQTVLDLLSLGYQVQVPVDAVSSRNDLDKQVAFRRMELSGATITTTEAVLFEWCEAAGTPEFKAISKLITGR